MCQGRLGTVVPVYSSTKVLVCVYTHTHHIIHHTYIFI
jgi:hypothetical protein